LYNDNMSTDQDLPEHHRSTLYLLLMFQRRMRALRLRLAPRVKAELNIVLSMIPDNDGISIGELARLSGIDNVKLSRLLANEVRQETLALSRSPNNHRTKIVSVTSDGRTKLAELRKLNNTLATLGSQPLNDQERARLAKLFSKLCNQLNSSNDTAINAARYEGEDPLVPQQRRLVATFGMTGASFFSSPYAITTYQILTALMNSATALTLANIKELLGIDAPSLSRELKALEQAKSIFRSKNPNDSRSPYFLLTQNGRSDFTTRFSKDDGRLDTALRDFTDIEKHELRRLLQRIATAPEFSSLDLTTTIHVCQAPEQFIQARKFLVEQLVKDGRHNNLSSTLLDEANCVVVAHQLGIVCAVLELSKRTFGWELTELELAAGINQSVILEALHRAFVSDAKIDKPIYVARALTQRVTLLRNFVEEVKSTNQSSYDLGILNKLSSLSRVITKQIA